MAGIVALWASRALILANHMELSQAAGHGAALALPLFGFRRSQLGDRDQHGGARGGESLRSVFSERSALARSTTSAIVWHVHRGCAPIRAVQPRAAAGRSRNRLSG